MTSLQVVYDAFLAKILEDEWSEWNPTEYLQDWRQILNAAIPWFKFPRVSLEIQGDNFVGDLTNNEVQILASYMKAEWVNRCILTWENIKPLYEERDFSQANLLGKLEEILIAERTKAAALESVYYRSRNFKPFNFKSLAGDQTNG